MSQFSQSNLGSFSNTIESNSEPTGLWESKVMVPTTYHPLVIALGDQAGQTLLAQDGLRRQHFTEMLELVVVTPEAIGIITGESYDFSVDIVNEASKIVVEEVQHAEYARNIKRRELHYLDKVGVKPPNFKLPVFVEKILNAGVNSRESRLFRTVSVFACETLITGGLSKLAHDNELDAGVRAFSKLHLKEESFHHAFFAKTFGAIWPQLSHAEQQYVVKSLLPNAIVDYQLESQSEFLNDLTNIGFSTSTAEQILFESFQEIDLNSRMRNAAMATLRHFRRIAHLEVDLPQQVWA